MLTKRSLALREFALGIEALERFVRKEPLRRVHECVFGVLALESEPGVGTTFFFIARVGLDGAHEPAADDTVPEGIRERTVLVVEDSPTSRDVLETFFQSDAGQEFPAAGIGGASRDPGDARRQADIFERVQFRQEMIGLKYKTDPRIAEPGQFAAGKLREILLAEPDFPRVG